MSNFYLESFKTFFKIGLFTLGGGYAMIPIIESEVVDKKKWVSKEDFLDIIAIAQSCPFGRLSPSRGVSNDTIFRALILHSRTLAAALAVPQN